MNLRRRGRHVQVGLLLAEHSRPALPMDRVVGWELEIRGSHGMQAHRYPAMMEMMRVGKLQPQKLLGKRIALDDAPAALMRMGTSGDPGISVITSF
jgi:alcohol dehydrogenase